MKTPAVSVQIALDADPKTAVALRFRDGKQHRFRFITLSDSAVLHEQLGRALTLLGNGKPRKRKYRRHKNKTKPQ